LVDVFVVENSGSDEWLVRLLSDSSDNTDGVPWSVSSSEEDDLAVSGGGIEGLDMLDLLVTSLGSSHEGDGVQREHLGVHFLACVPLELGSWLEVDWVQAESVHSVLGSDLSGVGDNLSLFLLERSEDGGGAILAWEVSELVVEGESVLSVVEWSQGLGSLLPDQLLALVGHVVWLGDHLEFWHVLLEWHDLTSVGKGVLWLDGSSDDDHLLVNGLEVEVKSWGGWSGEGLDSLETLDLLVLEEGVGPLLGWVLVAVPPGEEGLILVLVVLWGKALSGFVNELLVGEVNLDLIGLSSELSEHDVLSSLESVLWYLGGLVGDSEMSVRVESD